MLWFETDIKEFLPTISEMGYIVGSLNVLVPLITCLLVHRLGQKMFVLASSAIMAASMLFLALLSHFNNNDLLTFVTKSTSGFAWSVQAAILAFMAAHQIGISSKRSSKSH